MNDDIRPPKPQVSDGYKPTTSNKASGSEAISISVKDSTTPALDSTPVPDANKAKEPMTESSPKPKKKFFLKRLTKKQWIIIAVVGGVLLVAGSVGGWFWWRHHHSTHAPVVTKSTVSAPAKPTTLPSPLTGIEVAPDLTKRPVTGIMIENSLDARPQSGLKDAGVVFEAIAEGGITRFLALFQEAQPDYIGPIRSARPYYLDWLLSFDASLAHVGGSPDALSQIKALGVKDLDQFANGNSYTRITQRYAPHNVYTSIARLNDLENSKGYSTSTFTGFARKKESAAATPTAKTIDLNISSLLYNVHYNYDATTNSYKRSEGGQAHTDEKSGAQLSPKVVITLVTAKGLASDGQHSTYTTIGSGKIYVFQDGTEVEGLWQKSDHKSQLKFTDANGNDLKLNAGQTWISIVGGTTDVTFAP